MTPPNLASRLAATPPRTRALLVAGAVAAALLLAAADDPLLAGAGRAALFLAALGGAALLLRRRVPSEPTLAAIDLVERRSLSRDAAVALLQIGGRALLVGYGPDGVRLLADLGGPESIGRERP
jgi:flagellar protein FliO/FliZ